MATATRSETAHPPEEAARRLAGMSVETLIRLLQKKGYEYTNFDPDERPWTRKGRRSWGLTDRQIDAIIAGQARVMERPGEAPPKAAPTYSIPGHDGRSRIKKKSTVL